MQPIGDDMGTIIRLRLVSGDSLQLLCVHLCFTLSVRERKLVIRIPLSISLTLERPNTLSYCHVILLSMMPLFSMPVFHRLTGIVIGFGPSPHETYLPTFLLCYYKVSEKIACLFWQPFFSCRSVPCLPDPADTASCHGSSLHCIKIRDTLLSPTPWVGGFLPYKIVSDRPHFLHSDEFYAPTYTIYAYISLSAIQKLRHSWGVSF